MSPNLVPAPLEQFSSTMIFALSIFMVAAHSLFVAQAAPRTALPTRTRAVAPFLTAALLAGWLGVAVSITSKMNNVGQIEQALPGVLLTSLLVGFGPVVAAATLLFISRTVSALYAAMPPDWLIRIQSYRMAGLLFLYPFLHYGVISAGFAIPAALGDFLTGLFAPFVAAAVASRKRNAFGWAVGWNIFGISDLIVAPIAAVLSHSQVLQIYPLALVPLFLGPPLGILVHIYSLWRMTRERRALQPRVSPATNNVSLRQAASANTAS